MLFHQNLIKIGQGRQTIIQPSRDAESRRGWRVGERRRERGRGRENLGKWLSCVGEQKPRPPGGRGQGRGCGEE